MRRLCISILVLSLVTVINSEIFTSIADLQRLLAVEKNIPNLINDYIQTETQRLEQLKEWVSLEFLGINKCSLD